MTFQKITIVYVIDSLNIVNCENLFRAADSAEID